MELANTSPIFPFKEILAYEALWADKDTSFKSLATLFKKYPNSRPSDFITGNKIEPLSNDIKSFVMGSNTHYKTNILINGTFDFPTQLKDAKEPIELLYYTGDLTLLNTKCIAIVGTRTPSKEGLETTEYITSNLVTDDITIVSGLAAGIDTKAHTTAINGKGRTIAVLGTPLNKVYPKQNEDLQNKIAKEHLLLSQVPFYRYSKQDHRLNRFFFLERNKTMSALTEATIIIEAGETSGSLTQATAAVHQGRKILIWDGCFENANISWPNKFLEKGAIRVRDYQDIRKALKIG
jgi:DNA processing protein